ncbi:MAG: SDR family NAD(P)-dependent oxidoreductase [Bacteroidota bacterium]
MMKDFTGKKILITGASRGIGRATAIAFSKKGAKVGINYRTNDAAAQKTLDMLEGQGHQLLKYDIADETAVKTLVESFAHHFCSIDILINNAAIAEFHPINKVDFNNWKSSWHRILNTNLIAVANLCYYVSRKMIKQNYGHIVNVSSRGAFRGEPDQPAYGASKAGLNALTQSLAKSLGKYNIIVNAVAPGFTETDMGLDSITIKEKEKLLDETPLKRFAKPEEVANAIVYLASDEAAYTSGAILDLNGASYLRS